MEKYSLPQVIWLSIFSAPMYRHVAEHWRLRSFVYLFVALILCWTPTLVLLHRSVEEGFEQVRSRVIPNIPLLKIEKGVLKTPEARPYVLDYSEGAGSVRVVIDTTGKYRTLEEANANILLTSTQAMVRRSEHQTSTYGFEAVKDATFGPEEAKRWLTKAQQWIPWLLYPIIFVFSCLKRIVQCAFTAFLGVFMLRWSTAGLSYGALFTLAIVSLTPTLLLSTLFSLTGAVFTLQWLVFGLFNFGYFLFAIHAATGRLLEDSNS